MPRWDITDVSSRNRRQEFIGLPPVPPMPTPAPSLPTALAESKELLTAPLDIAAPKIEYGSLPSPDSTVIYQGGFLAIAFVDAKSISTTLIAKDDSSEVRAEIAERIRSAIAHRAVAHNLDLVLDKSGNSTNGVPVVLFSRKALDLTEEVRQELALENQ